MFLVFFVCLNATPLLAAFHGIDEQMGKPVSRSAVDTTGPEGGYLVGLQILRVHGEEITLSITSDDESFKDLDPNRVKILIDNTEITLPFMNYRPEVVVKSLPPIHQFWFGPVDEEVQNKLSKAKSIFINVPQKGGGDGTFIVGEDGLAEIKDVLAHAPIDGEEAKDPVFALKEDLARYEGLVKNDPQNYLYRNSLGETLFSLGRYQEAINQFVEVGKLSPHSQDEVFRYNRAATLYKLGKFAEAAGQFIQVSEILKNKTFKQQLTHGDLNPEFYTALCLYKTENNDKAIKTLDLLISQTIETCTEYKKNTTFENQKFEKTAAGYLWNNLLVFNGKEDFEKFVQSKVLMTQRGLNYYGALILRSLASSKLSDMKGALQDAQTAVAINPDSGVAIFLRGKWRSKNNLKDEAKKDLETAREKGFKDLKTSLSAEFESLTPLPYKPDLYFK